MPATVIGSLSPTPEPAGFPVAAPLVETKSAWSDPWEADPSLRLIDATAAAAGQDLGRLHVRREYGMVKDTYEADFAARPAVDLIGRWLRLRLVGGGASSGDAVVWTGRVSSETREVFGDAPVDSGVQTFTALEPLQLLLRLGVSTSYWDRDGVLQQIGWLPGFNARDRFRRLVGNRTGFTVGGTYLFEGSAAPGAVWSRYDALQYVLGRFVDESAAGGPKWTIGGQADLLKTMTDTVTLAETETAASLVRRLIPLRRGMDYKIVATDEGFEVSVYTLSSKEVTFAGASMPANPSTVVVNAGAAVENVRTTIARTSDHTYGRIRVLGNRAVVCCSLRGSALAAGSLVPKWSAALEAQYLGASGPPLFGGVPHPRDNDAVREHEQFRSVYQWFGADDAWDHNAGGAAPVIDAAGAPAGTGADFQVASRGLLPWVPLRDGIDYQSDPPVDLNPGDNQPEFLPPFALLYNGITDTFERSEEAGVGVSVSQTDWNVFLSASPNHRLAFGVFTDATANDSMYYPEGDGFDYRRSVVTVAFESDQRLALVWDGPEGASPSAGTLDIAVPDAELWYLAPDTAVGVDTAGGLRTSGGAGRVLRNDAGRLAQVMAGAIARYGADRGRATVVINGLHDWSGLLGKVLTVVDSDGELIDIDSPITSVAWSTGRTPTTVVKTGFAR